jgi:hypothetical protein
MWRKWSYGGSAPPTSAAAQMKFNMQGLNCRSAAGELPPIAVSSSSYNPGAARATTFLIGVALNLPTHLPKERPVLFVLRNFRNPLRMQCLGKTNALGAHVWKRPQAGNRRPCRMARETRVCFLGRASIPIPPKAEIIR